MTEKTSSLAVTRFIFTFRKVAQAVHSRGLWQYLRAGMQHRFGIEISRPRAPLLMIVKQVTKRSSFVCSTRSHKRVTKNRWSNRFSLRTDRNLRPE